MAQPTRTDTFDFNEQKVFQKIKDNLPKNETQNLLTVQDDLLCVWDSKNSSLLTLNWRAAKSADQNYQVKAIFLYIFKNLFQFNIFNF